MEKDYTKQKILNTALEMFSVQGFEATPISQIADAVGIRKASMYSPFCKQAGNSGYADGTDLRGIRKALSFCKGKLGRPCLYEG